MSDDPIRPGRLVRVTGGPGRGRLGHVEDVLRGSTSAGDVTLYRLTLVPKEGYGNLPAYVTSKNVTVVPVIPLTQYPDV